MNIKIVPGIVDENKFNDDLKYLGERSTTILELYKDKRVTAFFPYSEFRQLEINLGDIWLGSANKGSLTSGEYTFRHEIGERCIIGTVPHGDNDVEVVLDIYLHNKHERAETGEMCGQRIGHQACAYLTFAEEGITISRIGEKELVIEEPYQEQRIII